MAYQQQDNSGALFKNDKKQTDKHPDYTGHAMIGGVDMWVSAWVKESNSGTKFMSLSFRAKDEDRKPQRTQENDDGEDNLPF